ncbi:auxin-binding protein ABP19a-like [Silene latifolia]|uniref:auxin-binding protein ABP19a-like n=1 Tax=Silene latifolia TaxID=37657 RepID=UPI003D78AF47
MFFSIIIALVLFTSSSYANQIEFDYCVADPTLPHRPSGYSCKDPTKVTTDDFSYSGLRTPANTSNIFKFGVSYALLDQFPALNGLGLSMVRADIDVGGAGPIHAHRVAELAIVTEGTIIAGFIDTNNKPFYKTMEKGDLFVVPPALAHFQVNVGKMPAVVYAAFASPNPGVQAVDLALFKNDLPTEIIQKVTLLDVTQIKKLKNAFGGTN